jgi:hypothetical protein
MTHRYHSEISLRERNNSGIIDVRYQEKPGSDVLWAELRSLPDAVEKGKNQPIEIFACVPVETGFS